MVRFCSRMGVSVTAYAPMGAAAVPMKKEKDLVLLEEPLVSELAAKYEKTPA